MERVKGLRLRWWFMTLYFYVGVCPGGLVGFGYFILGGGSVFAGWAGVLGV